MSVIRAVVITPFVLNWYPLLVYLSPGATLSRVAGRVLIDQSIGSPIVIALVFAAHAVAKGDPKLCVEQLQHQFFTTWYTGLRVSA